jgi:hypothetical protein
MDCSDHESIVVETHDELPFAGDNFIQWRTKRKPNDVLEARKRFRSMTSVQASGSTAVHSTVMTGSETLDNQLFAGEVTKTTVLHSNEATGSDSCDRTHSRHVPQSIELASAASREYPSLPRSFLSECDLPVADDDEYDDEDDAGPYDAFEHSDHMAVDHMPCHVTESLGPVAATETSVVHSQILVSIALTLHF